MCGKHTFSWLILFTMLGCSRPAMPVMSKEKEQGLLKNAVLQFLSTVKRNPDLGAESLDQLMETLGAYKQKDETVDKIKALCDELDELYARKPPDSAIKPKLDELGKLANSLPGEVRVERTRRREGDGDN